MDEPTDPGMDLRVILRVAAVLLLALAGVALFAWLAWRHWQPNGPNSKPAVTITGPQLEVDPQDVWAGLQREQQGDRERWGWVADAPGVAVIPVSVAMRLLSERDPTVPSTSLSGAGGSVAQPAAALPANTAASVSPANIAAAVPPADTTAAVSPATTAAAPTSPASTPLVFTQQLDAALPLQLPLRDAAGRAVRLGDYFGAGPVILVLGYYRCRNLCEVTFDAVIQALTQGGAGNYRVLGVGIDPAEGPEQAAVKQAAYRAMLNDGPPDGQSSPTTPAGRGGGTTATAAAADRASPASPTSASPASPVSPASLASPATPVSRARLSLLTGDAVAVKILADSVGFAYRYDVRSGQFLHPAGCIVLTPDGHVSQYLLGVSYPPSLLRTALARAAAGRVGLMAERIRMLCSSLDPLGGGHGGVAMLAVRLTGGTTLLLLGWAAIRRRRRRSA